jgi:hypothetical protein
VAAAHRLFGRVPSTSLKKTQSTPDMFFFAGRSSAHAAAAASV